MLCSSSNKSTHDVPPPLEFQAARKELSGITKQKSKLETLCRTLTDERAKLKARLGEGAPPAEGDAAASE